MRKFRAVFIAAFLLSFTRAEVNPAVVDGMNQYIAGGYFANEYLLLNPLGREEEQAWDRLLRKENLTLMMEDHEWLSDFINLELREKFFSSNEHRLLVAVNANQFQQKLIELLTVYTDEQAEQEIQLNYARPFYADRIFRLLGKVLYRASRMRTQGWTNRLRGWWWKHWTPVYRKFVQRLPRLQYDSYVAFFLYLGGKNDRALSTFMLKAALELPATPEMIIRMRQLSFIFRKTPRPKEERSLAIEYLHRIKSSLKAGKDVFCEENATATRHASVDTSPSRRRNVPIIRKQSGKQAKDLEQPVEDSSWRAEKSEEQRLPGCESNWKYGSG